MEDRRGEHIFKRAERPVQVGVNEGGVEGRERPDPQHDVGRDARYQQDDVNQDRSDKQVDGVKPRRRDPLQIFRGMMDGVIFPESAPVKHAVQPIQHEIRCDQEQHRLHPKRKL